MSSETEADTRAGRRGAGSALYLRGLFVLALTLGVGAVGVSMTSALDDAHIAAGVVAYDAVGVFTPGAHAPELASALTTG